MIKKIRIDLISMDSVHFASKLVPKPHSKQTKNMHAKRIQDVMLRAVKIDPHGQCSWSKTGFINPIIELAFRLSMKKSLHHDASGKTFQTGLGTSIKR